MVPSPTELSVAVVSGVLRQTDPEPTGDSPDRDIVADVGNEIRVTLDRWTAGHLGIADLVAASVVMAVGFALAWFVKRLIRRAADNLSGTALASVGAMAQLAGGSVVLLAGAFALDTGADVEATSLIASSESSGLVDAMTAQFSTDGVRRNFKSGMKRLDLAGPVAEEIQHRIQRRVGVSDRLRAEGPSILEGGWAFNRRAGALQIQRQEAEAVLENRRNIGGQFLERGQVLLAEADADMQLRRRIRVGQVLARIAAATNGGR